MEIGEMCTQLAQGASLDQLHPAHKWLLYSDTLIFIYLENILWISPITDIIEDA